MVTPGVPAAGASGLSGALGACETAVEVVRVVVAAMGSPCLEDLTGDEADRHGQRLDVRAQVLLPLSGPEVREVLVDVRLDLGRRRVPQGGDVRIRREGRAVDDLLLRPLVLGLLVRGGGARLPRLLPVAGLVLGGALPDHPHVGRVGRPRDIEHDHIPDGQVALFEVPREARVGELGLHAHGVLDDLVPLHLCDFHSGTQERVDSSQM
jgi:hypothetical protein